MFYLTTRSTHFYLRLYGVRNMVKDHSDSEKGNPLLFFPISSKVFLYMHHPTYRITHTTAIVTPVAEHWLEQEIALRVHRTMNERSYHGATSRSLTFDRNHSLKSIVHKCYFITTVNFIFIETLKMVWCCE